MQNGRQRDRKASIIAAAITFGAALIILVLLFVLTVGDDRRMLAETSIPEYQDDEEIFLEPEMLVEHVGDEESDLDLEEVAKQPSGLPDPAPENQPVRVVRNDVPPPEEPVSTKPKLVSTDKPADVKSTTPKVSTEDEKRIAALGGKFKTENNGGNTSGESAGTSPVAQGVLSGSGVNGKRRMESCNTKTVSVSQKVVIKVNVVVAENGTVKSANATGGAGNPELRNQCVQWALKSRWTPQAGAGDVPGSITFTIIPKSVRN